MQMRMSIIVSVILAVITFLIYSTKKKERKALVVNERITMESLTKYVMHKVIDMLRCTDRSGKSDKEWFNLRKRLNRFSQALDNCVYGKDQDKILVKTMIKSVLKGRLHTIADISRVIDFSALYLDDNIKFEILLHYLKRQHGKDALVYLIKTFHIDDVKYDIEDGKTPCYGMTSQELDIAYTQFVPNDIPYETQIEVLATLVYERWKGFGCTDTLREMNIDGFNIGASGSILYDSIDGVESSVMKAPRSVWLFFEGKYIHLRYLNMGNIAEVRRITIAYARCGNPGPLTEKAGARVTSMWDQTRIVAWRPSACEYWAVFARKFSLGDKTIEDLLDPIVYTADGKPLIGPDGKPVHKYKRADIPLKLVEFLMRGEVTTAFTGRQGSGKTTLLTRVVEFIDGRHTLRILELAPEAYLREIYPQRNILSVRETATLTAEQEQDLLKKCDSLVSIVGEVATNIVAAQMIQFGRVASLFTLFTHHATSPEGLVYALRNSIVASTGMKESIAESDVLDVVHIDWHMDADTAGNRYVERVSEIIRLPEGVDYPVMSHTEPIYTLGVIVGEMARRLTDRQRFITKNILVFNKSTFTYETCSWLSDELTLYMASRMAKNYITEFAAFIQQNWGVA